MAQNIYDHAGFFEAYSNHIDRSGKESHLDSDPAWTRLYPLLPNVNGMTILDLGCGSGWFCRWAMNNGAKSALGIDISRNMIDKAKGLTTAEGVEYRCEDLERLKLASEYDGRYDLVFSSLTLHYLLDLEGLLRTIYRVLKPGKTFVCNVEHPIYTAPHTPKVIADPASGSKVWALSAYHDEGERNVDWLGSKVRKYHRTFTGYTELFFKVGFKVTGLVEFLPTKAELKSIDEVEALRPLFLMMRLRKGKEAIEDRSALP